MLSQFETVCKSAVLYVRQVYYLSTSSSQPELSMNLAKLTAAFVLSTIVSAGTVLGLTGCAPKLISSPTHMVSASAEVGKSLVFIYARSGPRAGTGSGFFLTSDGLIMTNAHVAAGADELIVTTADGESYSATLVGADVVADVAVIKIPVRNATPVRIGNPKDLRPGEAVGAAGAPFGLKNTITVGVVSNVSQKLNGIVTSLIQTDVSVNPGNSGGPLFNADGEVVGINSMIYTLSGGFDGISFAIPIDFAMNVASQF